MGLDDDNKNTKNIGLISVGNGVSLLNKIRLMTYTNTIREKYVIYNADIEPFRIVDLIEKYKLSEYNLIPVSYKGIDDLIESITVSIPFGVWNNLTVHHSSKIFVEIDETSETDTVLKIVPRIAYYEIIELSKNPTRQNMR